jgi:hypothetical protein
MLTNLSHSKVYFLTSIIANILIVCAAAIIPPYAGVSTGPLPSEATLFYPSDSVPANKFFSVGVSIETSRAGAIKVILNMTLIHPNGTIEPLGLAHDAEVEAYYIAPWPTCTDPVPFSTDTNQTLDDKATSASWRTSIAPPLNGS